MSLLYSKINVGSEGTVDYLKKFNTVFDIFNCDKDVQNNIFKTPIKPETKRIIFDFLDNFITYLDELKLDGKPIMTTRRKTAFIGFKNNSIALKLMYDELVETKQIDKICTTDLQQDLLESFFSRMRAKGGFNSNPTQEQFIGNFRRILLNNELTASDISNCVDKLDIMYVSSGQASQHTPDANFLMQMNIHEEHVDECVPESNEEEVEYRVIDEANMTAIEKLNAANMAGLIESIIQRNKKFSCVDCAMTFEMNIKIDADHFVKNKRTVLPCRSTVEICTTSLSIMSTYFKSVHISRFDYNELFDMIKKEINPQNLYIQSDFEHCVEHKSFIIDLIIEEIIKFRCYYLARSETLNGYETFVRSSKRHDTHFMGQ